MIQNRVLLIEDEPDARFSLQKYFERNGFQVNWADNCQRAMDSFRTTRPDAVIMDLRLPDGNALDLLPRMRESNAQTPVFILTAYGSIELAVRAVKEGAEQFLTKPVELHSLLVTVERILKNRRDRQKMAATQTPGVDPFLGTSRAIRQLAKEANRVLTSDSPVMIRGETGAGKSVLASWLHYNGPRTDKAFVDLNCAGLSRELLETELFGHEKGAFTGAITKKTGLLEIAHHGTVFLDEIGDMDLQIQPKLLKALEEKKFRRLGDVRDRLIDIKLIVATHQELALLVQEKKFRSDLYFRISTIPLSIPPLRDRVEDIPQLTSRFLEKISIDLDREQVTLSPEVESALLSYHWPGNIRELRNTLERAVLLCEDNIIRLEDLRFDLMGNLTLAAEHTDLTLSEIELRYISKVLGEERGNVDLAAKRLAISRSSLYQKIKRHNLSLHKL